MDKPLNLTTAVALIALATASVAQCADMQLQSATYLGGLQADEACAIDIAPDRSIVFAGKIPDSNFAAAPTELLGGGSGIVIRFNATGTQVLSVTRIGQSVDDMEINRSNGQVAVIGEFGAALLSSDANEVLWHRKLDPDGGGAVASNGRRIAIGNKGSVAALHGKRVTIFADNGTLLSLILPGKSYVEDVAIDDDTGRVFVVGFDNERLSALNKGCPNCPVQIAFMHCYDLKANRVWSNYDWTGAECDNGNEADSRGLRIAMGRDGKLIFGAESAGGNSIFRFNPRKLGEENQVIGDKYNHPYNTAANHISYYARLDPATGELLKGQFLLARKSDNRGNAVRMKAVAADEQGNVYVAGVSTYSMDEKSLPTVAGKTVVPAGGFVLVVSPDFSSRLLWTTFETDSYASTPKAIAAAAGAAVIASDAQKDAMVTLAAIQKEANNPSKDSPDAYLAVWNTTDQ
jgi:DNA-binding beta-propeller fold protein YncE